MGARNTTGFYTYATSRLSMPPTTGETAAFESGIKLGALYHQWSGVPVSEDTAGGLERAMTDSMSLQPYVDSAHVEIDRAALSRAINRFGYVGLSGEMLKASVCTVVSGTGARAMLEITDGFPLMRLVEVFDV